LSGKYIAIGDIHGCSATLEKLLVKLERWPEHQLVFVGDYIDRGKSSAQVVDRLLELEQERDCVFLRGNHEQMLLDSVDEGQLKRWLINGGEETLQSYDLTVENILRSGKDAFPEGHLDFYRRTKIYYDTPDYFFVHAGAPAGQTIRKSLEDPEAKTTFLWGRDHLNALETAWEKTVIFGHTARPFPIRKPKMIGIDTGCVYSKRGMGKLTAVVLPEMEFVNQISLEK